MLATRVAEDFESKSSKARKYASEIDVVADLVIALHALSAGECHWLVAMQNTPVSPR